MKHITLLLLIFGLPAASPAAPARHAAANKPVRHAASAVELAGAVHSALLRAAAKPAGNRPFSDVPPDYWAATAVETLRRKGIVVGYPAGTYRAKP